MENQVFNNHNGFECTCPDYQFRHERVGECKHVWALKYYLALKEKVQNDAKDIKEEPILCKYCNSSKVIHYGIRGKRVVKQIYLCKDCDRRFVMNTAFEKMRNDPKIISLALSMYFRNMSSRSISQTIEESYGVHIAHQTIHDWIKRYEKLLTDYVMKLEPNLSGTINVDELYVRVKGEMKYLFNALDPETRYLLASVLAQHKDVVGARELFRRVKRNGRRKIRTIISDGLQGYRTACKKEFGNDVKHIAGVRISGATNNNIIERLNGTKRDREQNFRGLKSDDTPILKLQDVFYNFIRKHQAIGMTPAEAAGVGFDLGQDKWLGLIKKAHEQKETPIKENKQLQKVRDEWKKKGWISD